MNELIIPWEIYPLVFIVAILYSSVGHGGASGYLALFALFGLAVPEVAPVVLILNILVAGTSFLRYRASGFFSAQLLLPFVILSVPAAFVGGALPVSRQAFTLVLGITLLLSALRVFILSSKDGVEEKLEGRRLWVRALPIGAGLGLISGMTGIGGGVFLSPILVLSRWASMKRSAAIASAFIVLNSISGLAGQLTRTPVNVRVLVPLAVVVIGGGAIGSYFGAARLRSRWLQIVLSLVLISAGSKLILQSL